MLEDGPSITVVTDLYRQCYKLSLDCAMRVRTNHFVFQDLSFMFYSRCLFMLLYILTLFYCISSEIFIRLFSGQYVVSVTWEMWQ